MGKEMLMFGDIEIEKINSSTILLPSFSALFFQKMEI